MKNILRPFIIGLFALLSINNSYASHFAGAELSYTCLGGSTYQITLSFFRDCSGTSEPSTATIYFACTNSPIFNYSVDLLLISLTGYEITNSCTSNLSSCNGGSGYGIREYVYQGIVSMPPCDDWNMYWEGTARNPINTLSGTSSWYIPAELNNLAAPSNSAPVFNNTMIPIANLNQLTTLDLGGVDPDGDSLSYSLYAPYTAGPDYLSSVTYNPPYSETDFIPSSTPITLDPITGKVTCTPTQILTAIIGIRVDQWRDINGVMTNIGTNYRDFNVRVVAAYTIPPTLSGIDFTSNHIYSPNDTIYTINKCIDGNPLVFSINGNDVDTYDSSNTGSPELFDISWDTLISSATFTPYNNGTDHAYAEFSWTPVDSNMNNNNYFRATIKDQGCPYNGENTYVYNINLIDKAISIGNDTTICYGDSLFVQSESNVSFTYYVWTIDGIAANTVPTEDFVNISQALLTPGVHTLKLETVGGSVACESYQEIEITVLEPLQEFSLGNDTTIANSASVTLTMPSGYSSYLWSTGSTANTITIDNSINWANTITGTAFDARGCSTSDEIVILFGNVGIDSQKESVFNVYPNPIDDVINIMFDSEVENAKLRLYDINGKLVRTAEFSSKEYTLKGLSDLPTGNYFMKITIDNKEFDYSIIKK